MQVSEIAKHQGDHAVDGDLLERALFTFGRSVHSSFTKTLSEGKARLDFRRPENREFWLAAARYTTDLGQRGTWRTAYEWAKLILSLDPEGDPYCIHKRLDQLALLGGQSEHYVQLAENRFFKDDLWKDSPNVMISTALAQNKLKQAQLCRATLQTTIGKYPWVFTRLFQELNLDLAPKSVWGQTAQSAREKFETENYVLGAKNLWSTPEAISLLVEVAETAPPYQAITDSYSTNTPLTIDEARYAIFSGRRELVNLVPREFTNMKSTSSDPLPPTDDLPSYDIGSDTGPIVHDPALDDAYADLSDDEGAIIQVGNDGGRMAVPRRLLQGITGLAARLYPGSGRQAGDTNAVPHTRDDMEDLAQRVVIEGPEPLQEVQQPGNVVIDDELEDLDRRHAQQVGADDGVESESRENNDTSNSDLDHDNEEHWSRFNDWPVGMRPDGELNIVHHSTAVANGTSEQPSNAENDQSVAEIDDEPLPREADVTDDQLRRYLAGRGVNLLREFSEKHGKENAGLWETPTGEKWLEVYASRLRRLKDKKTKDFILKYALPQGTSKEVARLVEQRM